MSTVDFAELYARRARAFEGKRETVAGGLALSGGGFRAMLFHVGSLRRLNELGALDPLHRISSVSGGSLTSARLALDWQRIVGPAAVASGFDDFQKRVFDFAGKRIDIASGLVGIVRPRRSISESVAKRYRPLLGERRLSEVPGAKPRFVFCATNLGTGSLLRFAEPYTADRRVGHRKNLDLPLTTVVAASSAFPPVLSPMRIELEKDVDDLTQQWPDDPIPELAGTDYARYLELSDGGVYDNLGVQPLERYHTMLVSDGGGPFEYEDSVKSDWVQHMIRTMKVIDNQVRSLRRLDLVTDMKKGRRRGAYWGINTAYSEYPDRVLDIHDSWSEYLSQVPTRLHKIDPTVRKQLINLGYGLADAAIRSYVVDEDDREKLPEVRLPFEDEPLSGPAPLPFGKKPVWKFW
ncbi:MAG: patatin-like phospholipase family protein [Actinomycetota bacterium]